MNLEAGKDARKLKRTSGWEYEPFPMPFAPPSWASLIPTISGKIGDGLFLGLPHYGYYYCYDML
jgi:hypothetical protein